MQYRTKAMLLVGSLLFSSCATFGKRTVNQTEIPSQRLLEEFSDSIDSYFSRLERTRNYYLERLKEHNSDVVFVRLSALVINIGNRLESLNKARSFLNFHYFPNPNEDYAQNVLRRINIEDVARGFIATSRYSLFDEGDLNYLDPRIVDQTLEWRNNSDILENYTR